MSQKKSPQVASSQSSAVGKQVTKRCHWVAQSYLKAFAADSNGLRIWRFSSNEGDPELKRIDKVAVKFHLYAPMGADGRRDDALERKLADLENFFGDPMWGAVCNDFQISHQDHCGRWSRSWLR